MAPFVRGLTLLACVSFVACSPDFTGTYEGPGSTTRSCPGESAQVVGGTIRFTISDVDDLLVADAVGCVGVPADTKGSKASILPYDCFSGYRPLSGDTSVTGGELELRGSDLVVSMSGKSTRGNEVCPFSTTGTLHRIVTPSSR